MSPKSATRLSPPRGVLGRATARVIGEDLSAPQRAWVLYFWLFFFALGVVENLRSALLPLIKHDLALSDQGVASLIMVGALASVLFLFLGGALIDKAGQRPLYHSAIALCTLALLCAPYVQSVSAGLLFFFALHAGFTLYSLLTNALLPTFGQGAGRLLTLSHGCYGLGAALSPHVTERLLASTGTWRESYQALALPFLLMWLALAYLSTPKRALDALARDDEGDVRARELLKDPSVWLFALLFGSIISAEVATSSWLVLYLAEVAELQRAEGALYLSGFYVLFTTGRFLGSGLSGAFQERPTLKVALSLAALCLLSALLLGALAPQLSGYALALSGLSFSLIFPSVVMSLNAYFPSRQAHILGLSTSGGLLMFMGVNALVGYVSERGSMWSAYGLMLGCVLLGLGCVSALERRLKRGVA